MNPMFQNLMNEAARLTRGGDLHAATDAIQRALQGGAMPASATSSHRPGVAASADADVIEAEVRVIDEAPVAYAEPTDTPAADSHAPAQWRDGSFAHGGRTLGYKLYLPPGAAAAAPMPLVLMLHGCTQDPADFAAGTQMNRLAQAHGVAVLYPAQTRHANAQGCWNWFKPQHQQRGRGEPALLAALTRSVTAAERIDPARVYVAGLSAGGAMADILGRAYPDLFAAVGVHSGLPTGAANDLMSALAAMRSGPATAAPSTRSAMPPLIVFHGDADGTVHVRNGAALVDGALGGVAASPAPARSGRSAAGRAYTRTDHPATAEHAAIEHWLLHGAGHAWSGGSATGSYTDPAGIDASAEMLRFFLAHARR
ncbi:MAG: PHB depolymerase family esterase [Comamonadaceae bacterium]|nr:MAG: PHB depolymerase family esterase [Comamonadaceae bacterium]